MNDIALASKQIRLRIEDLLAKDSKIFYENIFSTRHIGRVFDFFLFESKEFLAKTKDVVTSEYRARQIMELGLFNAWSNFRKGERAKCVEVECGWDESKWIFAVTFFLDIDVTGFMTGNPSNDVADRVSKMFAQAQSIADGLIVRHDPLSGKVHAILFLSPTAEADKPSLYVPIDAMAAQENSGEPSEQAPRPLSSAPLKEFLSEEKVDGESLKSVTVPTDEDWLSKVAAGEGTPTDTTQIGAKGEPLSAETFENSDLTLDGSSQTVRGQLDKGSTEATSVSDNSMADLDLIKAVAGSGPKVEDLLSVGGGPSASDQVSAISGSSKLQDETKRIISGGAAEKEGDLVRVRGQSASALPSSRGLHGSAGSKDVGSSTLASEVHGADVSSLGTPDKDAPLSDMPASEAPVSASSQSDSAQESEEGVELLLDTVKAEVTPLCVGLSEVQFQEAFRAMSEKIRENYTKTLHHMMRMKNIQNISKMGHYKDQIKSLSQRIEDLKSEKQDLVEIIARKDPTEGEILKLKAAQAQEEKEVSKTELAKDDAEFKEKMTVYQTALDKGEVHNTAQPWAKSLMETILKEKALLNQKMHSVEAHLRKKEHEFKTQETALKEQIRTKDEQLKQKDFAFQKTKESLTNAAQTIDKIRSSANMGNMDKMELANKLSTSERLLSVAKENNERMQKRVEDLQAKWHDEFTSRSALQTETSKLKKSVEELQRKLADPNSSKVEDPKLKMATQERDRALKVVDELKRQMKELQDKLTQSNTLLKAATAANDGNRRAGAGQNNAADAEMKHKLEQSNKMVRAMKDELEKTKKRYDDLKLEETKMRVEIGKLQTQLKAATKGAPGAKKGPR